MTDEQIKKSLECCAYHHFICPDDCPLINVDDCDEELMLNVAYFIDRREAELIAKTEEYNDMLEQRNKCEEAIERLEDSNKRLKEAVGLMLNNDNGVELIKAEAIKGYTYFLTCKAEQADFNILDIVDYMYEFLNGGVTATLLTADVKEVKHGHWCINPDGYYPYCSECKEEPESGKMSKFCPNCGADMGGKE